jgi:hypothetical protein
MPVGRQEFAARRGASNGTRAGKVSPGKLPKYQTVVRGERHDLEITDA